ncbi:MAG TPA: ABC transporter permease [Pseudomonas sp.]|uniref:ABC transporter permease n=1 Tax=Pseudomonas sp. TaxID=306 RepID=UPI002ED95E62
MSLTSLTVTPTHRLPRTRPFSALLCFGWPGAMLGIFVAVPFLLMLRVSLAPLDKAQLWGDGLTLAAFTQLGEHGIGNALFYSVAFAVSVSLVSLMVAYPLTWLITRMRKKAQVCWLIFLLATLSLSDVLITFSWQVMLARKMWISQSLVWLGLLDRTDSLVPGVGAVLCSLLYISIPFCVLLLFPALSRLDQSLIEAAKTMGASALQSFFGVVIPMTRLPIIAALVLSVVSAMGAYTAPLILGRPETWTLSVLIGNTVLSAQDFPTGTAMAVVLLSVTLLIGAISALVLRRGAKA